MKYYSSADLVELGMAEQARRNFWAYRQFVHRNLKRGWFQREIANHLQRFYADLKAGKKPKLVIQSPPQHGKSETVVDFISWVAGQNPDVKVIYTSYSDRLCIRANLRLQRVFDSRKYRLAFPETKITDYGQKEEGNSKTLRNQEILEYIGREGFFRNTTVGGSITGESLDIGVIDDPIKGREEASSETIREKKWDWLLNDFMTRFSEDAGLLTILTRWHIDDPIGRLIERMPDVKVLSYPAIAVEDEKYRKQGEALFPEHKSLEFLLERKALMWMPHWEALYQQNPIVAEGELFKPDKIKPVDAIPAGIVRWVRGWDLAASTDGDWTVGVLLGKMQDGRYIIADVVRVRRTPDERDATIKNTAAQDGHQVRISIPQDPGQAGKTQVKYMTRMLSGYRVTSSPESGDKVTRAEPIAAQVNVENVLMRKADWNNDFKEELRMFPNGKHDDQVDALSRAFSELIQRGRGFFA
jgi:predicted phage terminase large subunit-like protein